jgi:hypothetical protein
MVSSNSPTASDCEAIFAYFEAHPNEAATILHEEPFRKKQHAFGQMLREVNAARSMKQMKPISIETLRINFNRWLRAYEQRLAGHERVDCIMFEQLHVWMQKKPLMMEHQPLILKLHPTSKPKTTIPPAPTSSNAPLTTLDVPPMDAMQAHNTSIFSDDDALTEYESEEVEMEAKTLPKLKLRLKPSTETSDIAVAASNDPDKPEKKRRNPSSRPSSRPTSAAAMRPDPDFMLGDRNDGDNKEEEDASRLTSAQSRRRRRKSDQKVSPQHELYSKMMELEQTQTKVEYELKKQEQDLEARRLTWQHLLDTERMEMEYAYKQRETQKMLFDSRADLIVHCLQQGMRPDDVELVLRMAGFSHY